MKHNGFSLTEIAILIFTLVVIAAVLFPLKIIDLNQAERIAKWKTFYPSLVYSFNIMQHEEKHFIQSFIDDSSMDSDVFFEKFVQYLNVDKSQDIDTKYRKYRHYFLNGKVIKSLSKYDAKEFVALKNGMIIGFSKIEKNKTNFDTNIPLGILIVDVKGNTQINIIV